MSQPDSSNSKLLALLAADRVAADFTVDGVNPLLRRMPRLGAAGAFQLRLSDTFGNPLVDWRPYSAVNSAGVANWWITPDPGEVAPGHDLGVKNVLGVGGASTTKRR